MKHSLMLTLTFLFSLGSVFAVAEYPTSPNERLTPGSLCVTPQRYRYPERIPYCERDVSPQLKKEIFSQYRKQLGYSLDQDDRGDYKIDHFIPLCAGGSNQIDNLWPQHVSIYSVTDAMESLGCEKLAKGRILQKDLIVLIKQGKRNLALVPQIMDQLSRR